MMHLRMNKRNGYIFLSLLGILLMAGCQNHEPDTIDKTIHKMSVNAKTGQLPDKVADKDPAPAALSEGKLQLNIKAVKVPGHDGLWGYEIYSGERLLIRQVQVPALAGKAGFISAADAEKLAGMVAEKLKTGQVPSISLDELKQSKVAYKTYSK